ncbi:nucleotidyltransferase domain-containing protein [Compostibacter hankyongensis]|uniref:Nucleotidyltransferase domain-containing protein n=1 Tax=Compostibacter hankyongensis TaxID=1007089 RepID=A0ABP8FUN5_9BACT
MKYDYSAMLKAIIKERIPEDEYIVFLFGSRAAKNNKGTSDIDIGIWGRKPLPIRIKSDLKAAIEESIIPYFVDIVDFSRVNEQFKREALQHIELWSSPKSLNGLLKA